MNLDIASSKRGCQICIQQESIRASHIDVIFVFGMTIVVSVVLRGYRGKTVDFAEVGQYHRTTIAYIHQFHLKSSQDYGHQAVSVILSCNGIILDYAVILYDKSKIQIVQEIAEELPVAPVISYFLCDSWYTSAKVMDSFFPQEILYNWFVKDQPYHLSMRNSSKSQ